VNAIESATRATNVALGLLSATYDSSNKENMPPQAPITPIENTAASVASNNDNESTIHDEEYTIHDEEYTIHDEEYTIHDEEYTIHSIAHKKV
jgi:hypothetical protein